MTTAQTTDQLETFRRVLFDPLDCIEMRAVQDGRKTERRWITAFQLPRVSASLTEWNRDGWNLYVGANPRKADGGSKNNEVALARCLFVDFDDVHLAEIHRRLDDAAMPKPSMTVRTGHGFHLYYRLTEPLHNLGLWTLLQRALIGVLDSDRCIHDPARIMRLPGLLNVKRNPVPCEIVEFGIDAVYTLDEFPDPAPEPVTTVTPNGQVNQSDRWRAIEFLGRLDPKRAHDYDDWLDLGMILHGIDPDPGGMLFDAWERWSLQSDKWAGGECARKWATFDPSRSSLAHDSLTIATLHKWVIEDEKQLGVRPTRAKAGLHESEPEKPASDPRQVGSEPAKDPKSDSCKPPKGDVARNEYPAPIPFSQMGESEPIGWTWTGYLAGGYISLLTGLWKAGKTTLLAHVIRACGSGGYVGSKVAPCKVLLVTEEPQGMWSRRRDDLGIGDHAHCLARPFKAKPNHPQWRDFIQHIVGLIQDHGYGVVIFDTLGSVAPYVNENDAAEMQATLMPLQSIADTGAAVLLVHHPRKGDGDEGQASRGSGALTGFVDVIIELRRFDRKDRADKRRTLTTWSRFDESPPEMVVELTDDGYINLGSRGDATKADRAELILDILSPELPGMTVKEIKEAWAEQDATPPSEKTIRNDLEYGFSKARWLRAGAGTRGDPYTYRLGERDPP